jgi:hypothetical protein
VIEHLRAALHLHGHLGPHGVVEQSREGNELDHGSAVDT